MKDILTAPFMVEMIRTTTNMYNHGWDERNGGNISLLLDEAEVAEYLDTTRVLRTIPTGFSAPSLAGKYFLVTGTGKYFKNVDSDDTLSGGFPAFLDELERVDREGGVDIFFTNYYYVHTDGVGDRSINLSNAFPENRVFTWADTKSFRVDQVLMLHTCTFSTQMLRDTGIELPLHMFYEDNYMVYGNLKNAERMYYINTDLYRYTIGREGQSMAEESMKKRYTHQLKAAELCFTSFHLDDVPDRRKRKYLSHELFILLGGAIFFARLNRTEESDAKLEEMWENCRAYDRKWADHFRYRTPLLFLMFPGRFGQSMSGFFYRVSRKVVKFN